MEIKKKIKIKKIKKKIQFLQKFVLLLDLFGKHKQ